MSSNERNRLFLAGATGVLGQRLIPQLIQAGYIVGGMTRSGSQVSLLGARRAADRVRRLRQNWTDQRDD
jgi:nucleoside-diphosphate-sugar epimerase